MCHKLLCRSLDSVRVTQADYLGWEDWVPNAKSCVQQPTSPSLFWSQWATFICLPWDFSNGDDSSAHVEHSVSRDSTMVGDLPAQFPAAASVSL